MHETGTAHGTVTAVVCGEPVEVTTYPIDGAYTDQRHPDSVTFVIDVREDLARRDFTVNAMAWHPTRGLLDPFGGAKDVAVGVIRAVGDPAVRFDEDALRILRAVRFAARLDFDIEPATQAALAPPPTLAGVAQSTSAPSCEASSVSGRAAWALRHQREVMFAALPELAPMEGFDQRSRYHCFDVLEHTICVMEGVEQLTVGKASERLRWAAMLHDIGKPTSSRSTRPARGTSMATPDGASTSPRPSCAVSPSLTSSPIPSLPSSATTTAPALPRSSPCSSSRPRWPP